MSPESFEKGKEDLKKLQKKLNSFSPEKLSKENQIIYDILRLSFATQLSAADDYLLAEPLGANLGTSGTASCSYWQNTPFVASLMEISKTIFPGLPR